MNFISKNEKLYYNVILQGDKIMKENLFVLGGVFVVSYLGKKGVVCIYQMLFLDRLLRNL